MTAGCVELIELILSTVNTFFFLNTKCIPGSNFSVRQMKFDADVYSSVAPQRQMNILESFTLGSTVILALTAYSDSVTTPN